MSALLFTTYVPWERERSRHGVFQRMRMMIDATRVAFGHVRVILVASSDSIARADSPESLPSWMEGDIGPGVEVRLEALRVPPVARGSRHSNRIERLFGTNPFWMAKFAGNAQFVDRHIRDTSPMALVCHRIASYAIVARSRLARTYPRFLDLDDIEHLAYARAVLAPPHWGTKPLQLVRVPQLMLWEWRAMRDSQGVFVCSELDQRKLSYRWNGASVLAIPNSVDDPGLIDNLVSDSTVLFVGAFNYQANRTGVAWFLANVWPVVLSRCPTSRLILAGRGSETMEIPAAISPSVTTLGFVDELTSLYRSSSLVVCPLLTGGGTRIKIIEAAAHCRAVVSTAIGAEGLKFRHNESILLADEPGAFAQSIELLLQDGKYAAQVAANARDVYQRNYARPEIVTGLAAEMARRARTATHSLP